MVRDRDLGRLYERLTDVAERQTTNYYSWVAPFIGMHHRSLIFHTLLDIISRHEVERDRPMLTAVVVCRDRSRFTEISGSGFFRLAEELGLYQAEGKTAFWREEVRKVHDYWAAYNG